MMDFYTWLLTAKRRMTLSEVASTLLTSNLHAYEMTVCAGFDALDSDYSRFPLMSSCRDKRAHMAIRHTRFVTVVDRDYL